MHRIVLTYSRHRHHICRAEGQLKLRNIIRKRNQMIEVEKHYQNKESKDFKNLLKHHKYRIASIQVGNVTALMNPLNPAIKPGFWHFTGRIFHFKTYLTGVYKISTLTISVKDFPNRQFDVMFYRLHVINFFYLWLYKVHYNTK